MSNDTLLIKNVTILPMTNEDELIDNGYIYIENGFISEVNEGRNPEHLNHANKIIDGQKTVAIPGLINGHTHTPMSILRGYADDLPLMEWLQKIWAVEGRMTEDDMYWGSMLSMMEMIKSGTTTFSDMYYGMDKVASGVEKSGLRALLCQGIIEGDNNGDELLATTTDFAERWNKGANERITTLLSPHAPYTCSPELIEKLVKEAHRLDCSIHTHLAETRDEIAIISERHGETPIQLMEKIGLFTRHVIAAHGVYLTDEEIDILQKRQVGLIHNPKSNMKLASGIAPITTLLERGVTVGIGTDSAASNNVLDMFEEMRFASLLQKVHLESPTALTAYESLAMGTSMGAQAVGLTDEIGTIEVNKKADITLVDFSNVHLQPINDIVSHLIYSVKAEDVAYTIVDGRILLENGHLTTIDQEEVYWHIAKIKETLL